MRCRRCHGAYKGNSPTGMHYNCYEGMDDELATLPARPIPGMAVIYALVDPGDGRIKYVGRTRGKLASRLKQHLRVRHGATDKDAWIALLNANGKVPIMHALEMVPIAEEAAAERRWIARNRELTNAFPPQTLEQRRRHQRYNVRVRRERMAEQPTPVSKSHPNSVQDK